METPKTSRFSQRRRACRNVTRAASLTGSLVGQHVMLKSSTGRGSALTTRWPGTSELQCSRHRSRHRPMTLFRPSGLSRTTRSTSLSKTVAHPPTTAPKAFSRESSDETPVISQAFPGPECTPEVAQSRRARPPTLPHMRCSRIWPSSSTSLGAHRTPCEATGR